jgi:hypothetical protein
LNLIALQLLYPVLHLPNDQFVILSAGVKSPNLCLQPLDRRQQGVLLANGPFSGTGFANFVAVD